MRHTPRAEEIYRHFKGKLYQVITVAQHSESKERFVVYQALYGSFQTYVRPLIMFMEKVDREKYPDALQEYQFELVEREEELAQPDGAQENGSDAVKEKDGAAKGGGAGQGDNSTASNDNAGKAADSEGQADAGNGNIAQEAEELNLDPLILEFLDASSYGERLNILSRLHCRITDDMVNVMAMATDIEVKPGDIEERYVELRNCLLKMEKYECNRLRG